MDSWKDRDTGVGAALPERWISIGQASSAPKARAHRPLSPLPVDVYRGVYTHRTILGDTLSTLLRVGATPAAVLRNTAAHRRKTCSFRRNSVAYRRNTAPRRRNNVAFLRSTGTRATRWVSH